MPVLFATVNQNYALVIEIVQVITREKGDTSTNTFSERPYKNAV